MCFFRKKVKKEIDSKFKMGALVGFRYRGELTFGNVYEIFETPSGIIYTIQVAGQCPWFAENIKEEELRPYKTPRV